QFSRRITLADTTIRGVDIAKGTFVLTCLGSANRDAEQWGAGADALDLGRPGAGQHISFGSGRPPRLGAFLGRLDGQAALGEMMRRFPNMDLTVDEPERNNRIVLRGFEHLPVTLGR